MELRFHPGPVYCLLYIAKDFDKISCLVGNIIPVICDKTVGYANLGLIKLYACFKVMIMNRRTCFQIKM
jgi:hypothetical protein